MSKRIPPSQSARLPDTRSPPVVHNAQLFVKSFRTLKPCNKGFMDEKPFETVDERMRRERAERLRAARQTVLNGRLKTVEDAARYLRVKKSTYSQHENGIRGIGRSATMYARAFGVSLDWLMNGDGDMRVGDAAQVWADSDELFAEAQRNAVRLSQLLVETLQSDRQMQDRVIDLIEDELDRRVTQLPAISSQSKSDD